MFNRLTQLVLVTLIAFFVSSCQVDDLAIQDEVPSDVITKLTEMGFNPDGIEVVEEGYRIERDIIITKELLASTPTSSVVPNAEQYRTTNLVNAGSGRNITMYAPTGRKGYDAAMLAGLDEAISRYNAENLSITFSRVSSSNGADIVMSRLSKRDERRGVLGSAGFPSASGDPYNQIKMSGILSSSYGLGTNGIATIIAHEMGHCVGFRHTDYFDRSISCGGATSNEGQAGVGAIHISGTPTGANPNSDLSFMLSCTDGGNRPFTNNDVTALNALY